MLTSARYMQHFSAIAEMINLSCVPRIKTYILNIATATMFNLYFNRFLEDVNFVIPNLCFQMWFYSFSNQCFLFYCSFFLPIFYLSSQCHVVARREILVQSPGVIWWAQTICSWLSLEITVCVTLTNQLPKTILDDFILHKQLANEPWWQLPYFSDIY